MRLNELLDLVSESINAKLVYPFNGGKIKSNIVYHVFQNKRNDKMIVAVFEKDGDLLINIKLTAEHVDELILINGVERGYHMNKKYWVTVDVNNTDVSRDELVGMIQEAEEIIAEK